MSNFHKLLCSTELLEYEIKDIKSKEYSSNSEKMLLKRFEDELNMIKESYLIDKKSYRELCDKAVKYEKIKAALGINQINPKCEGCYALVNGLTEDCVYCSRNKEEKDE